MGKHIEQKGFKSCLDAMNAVHLDERRMKYELTEQMVGSINPL